MSTEFFFYFTNKFFYHKQFFLYIFKTTQQVVDYIKTTGSQTEQEIASDIVLHILDIIMQSEFSLNKQKVRIFFFFSFHLKFSFLIKFFFKQHIKQLQDLVQSASMNHKTIISAPISSASAASTSQSHQLNSFRLHTSSIKALPFDLQIYG